MTIKELQQRQAWTLPQKIDHSLGVIDQFASHFDGKVYVSFSGGKDSVAMLSLVEMIIPRVPAVFVMTGCESPSVCRFIREQREHHDIEIVRPEKTMKQIFAEYGFPLVGKEISYDISTIRKNPYTPTARRKLWLANPYHIPEKWLYLLNEPYMVSDRCCYWLKKQPLLKYTRETGRHPYVGILADEGRSRTLGYLQRGGCNSFKQSRGVHPKSWPLAIWTERDVWAYIKDRQLSLPDIYEKGDHRTGCMGCAFGAHHSDEPFATLRRLWPKWYDLIMSYENNGVTYGEAVAKMLERAKHNPYNANHKDLQASKTDE